MTDLVGDERGKLFFVSHGERWWGYKNHSALI
jgi:hypothetical protein